MSRNAVDFVNNRLNLKKGQNMTDKGFTLLELLIVIIIIGVLATLFLPNFRPARESALNDEARANLKLIQAAEKIYKLEYNVYFTGPDGAATSNETEINQWLKLALPAGAPLKWRYQIVSPTGQPTSTNFNAIAERNTTQLPERFQRNFSINATMEEPVCQGSFCQ
ncbi:MAG: prepilin-type N-terminal cleavage/methylation domain-containing protein [Candidatus Omnitrophica bacterium]|nr:prepilin-type N-terminal cleavage/methylation domain-containing protein [Candidatus Omnitrophota bacterium]